MTTKKDIQNALFRGADTFRGTVNADQYKDYLLSILFMKYLSDTYQEKVTELKDKYQDEVRLERQIERLPYKVRKEFSFSYLYENRFDDNLGQKINEALRGIESDNSAEFTGIFRNVDFNNQAVFGERTSRNVLLRELLGDFINLDLKLKSIETHDNELPADVIGDAYEYMIGEFASRAGNKAGNFFTPQMVSEIVARITNPISGERIYDPTCGSGSLLIRAGKIGGLDKVRLYGQESMGTNVAMCKMNMFLHEIGDAKIAWGDSLANPLHKDDDGNLLTFDVIVANMPFSLAKWAKGFNPGGESDGKESKNGKDKKFSMESNLDPYHRFDWGVPPSSKGDWAFLLHMIHSMSSRGRIAAVAPHGVLFRGASEGRIRQAVIKNNLLDAVIGLPANLFYGTSIPASILVFKKNRDNTDVLFIDASGDEYYTKGKNQNILRKADVDRIINAYRERRDIDKFAHVATIREIKENDYNLNIPRYVDTFEEEKLIDIEEVQNNIRNIKAELAEVEKKMEEYIRELGIDA